MQQADVPTYKRIGLGREWYSAVCRSSPRGERAYGYIGLVRITAPVIRLRHFEDGRQAGPLLVLPIAGVVPRQATGILPNRMQRNVGLAIIVCLPPGQRPRSAPKLVLSKPDDKCRSGVCLQMCDDDRQLR